MLNKLTMKYLFWVVTLMAILATLMGVLGLTGMAKSNDGLKTVYLDRTICIAQLSGIKVKILSNRLAVANSLAFKEETPKNISSIKQNLLDIDKLWQEYRATKYTQEEFRLSEKFEKDKLQLLQEGLTPGIDYLQAGNAEAVEKIIKTAIRPLFVIVEDDIDRLIQIQVDVAKQEYLSSQAGYDSNRLVIILILLTKILLALVILAYIKVTIAKIGKVIAATERIAADEFDTQVGVEGKDEISEIAKSIAKMQNVLRDARDETNRLNWLKTGVVRVNKVVLGQMDITTLASKVINEIADYLDAKVGAVYIASEVGTTLELSLIGSFAYTHRKNLSSQFKLGEGLVGQSALERKQILLDNVPEDYIRISSGLGDTVPRNICVTPMLFEQTLEGVLEIGTLVPLKPIELEYLRLVIEAVAMAFEIAKTQSSMQSQQVALLTSNEELEAQVKIVA